MWLPHGLADNTTTLQALAGQVSICPIRNSLGLPILPCRPMAFNLTRPTRGNLMMSVPGIQPLTQYRVTITASGAVRGEVKGRQLGRCGGGGGELVHPV
jgi:hypothetical protein